MNDSRRSLSATFFARALGVLFIVACFLPAALLMRDSGMLRVTGFLNPDDLGFSKFFWKILEAVIDTARLSSDTSPDTLPPCKEPTCLDEGIGARLFQEEIRHLYNILDLADGFGRPLGQVFEVEWE